MDTENHGELLIKIDTKLKILLDNFDKHTEDENKKFERANNRLDRLERVYYIGIGAVGLGSYIVGKVFK